MASTINIPKSHLIMALCLPLAVLMGYLLAEPIDSGNLAVLMLVIGTLAVPVLMKYHHPLVVLSWNARITPMFLPGQPLIWMIVAPVSLVFAVLNRSVKADFRFLHVPRVTKSLLSLLGVVLITAFATGGIGIRALGGSNYGGKGYLYIIGGVAGYFAMTCQRVPVERSGLYLAMFFLPALTALIPNLAYAAGSSFYFVFNLFPSGEAMEQAQAEGALAGSNIFRIGGLAIAGLGLYSYLLARFGARGVLKRPLVFLAFLAAVVCCATSGFRSSLILFLVAFLVVFFLEGLHRTRLMLVLLLALTLVSVGIFVAAERLPLVVQRAIAFLPVKVDPIARLQADGSTEWRLDIWKAVLPMVPRYLLMGKGYTIDSRDLYMGFQSRSFSSGNVAYGTILAGDYHNGPLSVIIPFGIWGVAAFLWFLTASLRTLYQYYRDGDPALRQANTLLLGMFTAKVLFFFLVFGSLYTDLCTFTGLIGLAVSLNGPPKEVPVEEPTEELPEAAFEGLS